MFKKLKVIIKILEWLIFVVLLSFIFILLSPKLPFKNLPKSFIIISGSMEPTIPTGSVVLVKETDPKNLKIGDIVAFTSPNNANDTIVHRINSVSSVNPLRFKTKGDNNNSVDDWDIMDVGVKGVLIGFVPYIGYLASFIRTKLGFSLVIGIPALIFIFIQFLNIKKAIAEEVEKKVNQKIAQVKKADFTGKKNSSIKTVLKSIVFLVIFSEFIFTLYQIGTAKAVFSDTVDINDITISIKDFVAPPIPTLISPLNESFLNTSGLIMKWNSVVDYENMNNPVYYIYQSSHVSDFSFITYQSAYLSSSQIPAPGTPDGIYYWRVKACDAIDNCSDWSSVWKVTVDSTIPNSTVTSPANSSNFNSPQITILPLRIWYWNGKIEGTAADNLSGVHHVELSIERTGVHLFWSGDTSRGINGWVDDPNVRVIAVGTTSWSYQINPFYLPLGKFKIVAHAVDNAGNIENSATIVFEYLPTPTSNTDINISSNHSANKINLEITNISSSLDYEILYTGNEVEKGISGHINPDEIINSKYTKDFYFGTCSTGGACTPENVEIGSTITVNLTGDQNITKTFTY